MNNNNPNGVGGVDRTSEPDEPCAHDSCSGDEGPIADMGGRDVVRWRCDGCGEIVRSQERAIVRQFLDSPLAFWDCPRCTCAFSPPMERSAAEAEATEHDAWHDHWDQASEVRSRG